jgi:hypothetical protein
MVGALQNGLYGLEHTGGRAAGGYELHGAARAGGPRVFRRERIPFAGIQGDYAIA